MPGTSNYAWGGWSSPAVYADQYNAPVVPFVAIHTNSSTGAAGSSLGLSSTQPFAGTVGASAATTMASWPAWQLYTLGNAGYYLAHRWDEEQLEKINSQKHKFKLEEIW